MNIYDDHRQHFAQHHVFTSVIAVWKSDKAHAWFLKGATIANETTSTPTILNNLS